MNPICNRCNKYEVSMCGSSETCHAKKEGSKVILYITDDYIEPRMNGEINHCKAFKKITLPTYMTKT